eukprot:jgi/Mesen1/1936/ME000146S01017
MGERGQSGGGRTARTFAAGALSGIITSCALQPLDVIRTQMQAGAVNGQKVTSMGGVFRSIVQKQGVTGLWRGTGPTAIRIGLGAGLYFSLLDYALLVLHSLPRTKDLPRDKLPASLTMTAGAVTRGIAAAALCPVTVVKTRMEYVREGSSQYRGTLHALTSIGRTEGLRGLFSGLGPTLVRDAPYSGLYLLLYARLRNSLKESWLPVAVPQSTANFIAGGTAGALATLVTHPADVVRTLLQLEGGQTKTVRGTVSFIWQKHGPAGFFRGVVPRMSKRALQQALTWTIYEELVCLVLGASLWASNTSPPSSSMAARTRVKGEEVNAPAQDQETAS